MYIKITSTTIFSQVQRQTFFFVEEVPLRIISNALLRLQFLVLSTKFFCVNNTKKNLSNNIKKIVAVVMKQT